MFVFAIIFFMESFLFEQQVLLRVDFFSVAMDFRVQYPSVGLEVKINDSFGLF